MAETTIEWTRRRMPDGSVLPGYTHNEWVGCAKVSEACRGCYAESWAKRAGQPELWGQVADGGVRRQTSVANRRKPLRWNRETPGAFVFSNSLSDVFEDAPDLDAYRDGLFETITATPNLTWLLLTKRPEVAAAWFRTRPVPKNVWVGCTVENQKRLEERIPWLLQIRAPLFVSCEPLLGPLDFTRVAVPYDDHSMLINALNGRYEPREGFDPGWAENYIRWVIGGGESGGDARPTHPRWAYDLRDQAKEYGAFFHWKQWGEWLPICEMKDEQVDGLYRSRRRAREHEDQGTIDELYGRRCTVPTKILHVDGKHAEDAREPGAFLSGTYPMQAFRVGKKQAGNGLGGRTWLEHPPVR